MQPHGNAPSSQGLRWFGCTDKGRVRRNNEDAFLALQFDAREVQYLGRFGEDSNATKDFVFAVSDGMGGARSGEFASRVTVDRITHLLPPAFRHGAKGFEIGFDDLYGELFAEIHSDLMHLGDSYAECHGMGATLSLCWFRPDRMHFAHIGDSRIYYLPANDGSLMQLTHDDTHVGWLFRRGDLNERQARTHPRRNVLQKALGAGHQFVTPQVGSVPHQPGDVFLLCTDGLVEGLFDQQLNELLRDIAGRTENANLAETLVRRSIADAGRDNTTAVVISVL